jgi:hypothetical protein
MSVRPCAETTPEMSDGLARFVISLRNGSETQMGGLERYHAASTRLGYAGARDFEDIFIGSYTDDPEKAVGDLLEAIGVTRECLTDKGFDTLLRQMWQGGATDRFDSTQGVFYTARHIVKTGKIPIDDALLLAEVPEPAYDRFIDLVIHLRREWEDVSSFKQVRSEDVVAVIEVKWISASTSFSRYKDQIAKDFQRSIDRYHTLDNMYYAIPADYPQEMILEARKVMLGVFDETTGPYLKGAYGYDDAAVADARRVLEDRVYGEEFFWLIPH